MTDKVQKIRKEVQRLMNELIQEKERGYGSDVDDACILELQNVLTFINSLQEEPKFKIGDIIRFKGNETLEGEEKTHKIVGYDNELYIFDDGTTDLFCEQELYELVKEPASEELEKASRNYADNEEYGDDVYFAIKAAFKEGAKWQKEHLWKPANGDDLPIFDREVIVLYQRYPLEDSEYAVGFAHRPPEYWDGKNIETNEVTRYYPKRYDKGGWNIPDVKFWLDLELPIQKGE